MANSGARIAIVESHGGKPRLSGESQVAPFTLNDVRSAAPQRPKDFSRQMEVSTGGKIVCLGGCAFWP